MLLIRACAEDGMAKRAAELRRLRDALAETGALENDFSKYELKNDAAAATGRGSGRGRRTWGGSGRSSHPRAGPGEDDGRGDRGRASWKDAGGSVGGAIATRVAWQARLKLGCLMKCTPRPSLPGHRRPRARPGSREGGGLGSGGVEAAASRAARSVVTHDPPSRAPGDAQKPFRPGINGRLAIVRTARASRAPSQHFPLFSHRHRHFPRSSQLARLRARTVAPPPPRAVPRCRAPRRARARLPRAPRASPRRAPLSASSSRGPRARVSATGRRGGGPPGAPLRAYAPTRPGSSSMDHDDHGASAAEGPAGEPAPSSAATAPPPLLVFVNGKSGGRRGERLKTALACAPDLDALDVVDLGAARGPEAALRAHGHVEGLRILVCGGDGTVAWVLQALEDLEEVRETLGRADPRVNPPPRASKRAVPRGSVLPATPRDFFANLRGIRFQRSLLPTIPKNSQKLSSFVGSQHPPPPLKTTPPPPPSSAPP